MDAVFVFSVRAFSVKVMSVKIALGLLLMTVVNHMPMTRICEFEQDKINLFLDYPPVV